MSGAGPPGAGAGAENGPPGGLLRQRMPEFLAVFGAGLGAAVTVGLVIGAVSSTDVVIAVGYTVIMLGVVLLLAGGATGGGYTNMSLGAVGSLFGGRSVGPDADIDDPEVGGGRFRRRDPMERLRRGLRPEANPRAFWQVIGGFAYLAVGVALVQIFS